MNLRSRRTGVATRAVTVVRYGDEYAGTPHGARCAVKGCSDEATMFCRKQMGTVGGSVAAPKVVAVLGYCVTHDEVANRFQASRAWVG